MLGFIKKNTTFYVVAPANTATGGPELLHQLASKLRADGRSVYMVYFPVVEVPTHENYKAYDLPFVRSIDDSERNVLIVPETLTGLLSNYLKIKKIIWWLSVDNYFIGMRGLKGKINRFLLHYLDIQRYFFFNEKLRLVDAHLVQSEYAKKTLEIYDISNTYFLSDYLQETFLLGNASISGKENIVTYNPKKGKRFTDKIISSSEGIRFVPIENMSRDQVVSLLKRSKVYIDFGFHPGKDRIPREAAFLNNCVITNTRGSAKYYRDLPIPEQFKFDEKNCCLSEIKNKIEDCFEKFESNLTHFECYRAEILAQEYVFNLEVSECF